MDERQRRIDKLLDRRDAVVSEYANMEFGWEILGNETRAGVRRVERLKEEERAIDRQIALLEDCEHSEREGSSDEWRCPDCGAEGP